MEMTSKLVDLVQEYETGKWTLINIVIIRNHIPILLTYSQACKIHIAYGNNARAR